MKWQGHWNECLNKASDEIEIIDFCDMLLWAVIQRLSIVYQSQSG